MSNTFEKELTERAIAQAKLAAMVMDDPALRARLLADPRAVLREIAGVEIPDTITVAVHEESADAFHLVIPPALPDELSEDQLDSVAGGANSPGGANSFSPFTKAFMAGESGGIASTMAVGEEGGGSTHKW